MFLLGLVNETLAAVMTAVADATVASFPFSGWPQAPAASCDS